MAYPDLALLASGAADHDSPSDDGDPTVATVAPKPRRKPRRGPPGVPCPSCHKLAGSDDDGTAELDSLSVSDAGEIEAEVTLTLQTACCGDDFKSYQLSGSIEVADNHNQECPKIQEIEQLDQDIAFHATGVGDGHSADVKQCEADPPCTESEPSDECEEGFKLHETRNELQAAYENEDTYEESSNDDPEPYSRSEGRGRFTKTFRGVTFSGEITHLACGEQVGFSFEEQDLEDAAGNFEIV